MAYNPSAITEEDIDVYANHTSSPDGLRAGFEYFRAFPQDAEQNKESAKSKITMPVLVLGGDICPALGGDFPGNMGLSSTQTFTSNCNRGHCFTIRALDARRTTKICH